MFRGGVMRCSLVVNLLCVGCRFAVSFVRYRLTTFTDIINCDNFAKWIADQGGWVSRSVDSSRS